MGLTEFLVEHFTQWIGSGGYWGVMILMTLESMVAPVPSEAVMPFAGFLIYEGRFTFTAVIFFSTLGSIIGSLISYYAGAWAGRPFVKRFGKYLLLDLHHLDMTERFFGRYGDKAIFVSRHSGRQASHCKSRAGVGRMSVIKFSIYTIIGAAIWNAFLTYVGYYLKDNWMTVRKYGEIADIVVVGLMLAGIAFITFHYISRRKRAK